MINWNLDGNTADLWSFTIKKGSSILINGYFETEAYESCEDANCFEREISIEDIRYPLECVLQHDLDINCNGSLAAEGRPVNLKETTLKNEKAFAKFMQNHIATTHNEKQEKQKRLKDLENQINRLEEETARLKQLKNDFVNNGKLPSYKRVAKKKAAKKYQNEAEL